MSDRSFHMPTRVVQQAGLLRAVHPFISALGKRPMIVTGRHSARRNGWVGTILDQLPDASIFEGITENPSTTQCDAGGEAARERDVDCIVALGGGSPIDAAKAIAVLATNPGRTRDYFGRDQYGTPALPIVAIPTTAGTGSEVTPYAVIVDAEAHQKRTLAGMDLFPRTAVLDPELTLSMPRDVTIATGLDALSQAMEGFVSIKATEVGDLLALEACRIIRSYLPVAANDPQNLEARGQMLYAANLSGTIIAQSGTTLVHGMGYYYTLHHDVAHGLANALLLSPVFEWNARHLPQKVAALAGALGVICPAEPVSAAVGIREALVGFLETLGVSPAARDAGVSSAALADHATDIAGDPYRFKNQVGSLDPSHIEQLFRASWAGESADFD